MQCAWQKLTGLAIRCHVNRLLNIRSLRGSITPSCTKIFLLRTFSTSTDVVTNSTIRQHNPTKPALLETEATLTDPELTEDEKKLSTSVELARAAARVVHSCLRTGNISDACKAVFDKDVSSRLPSHALLHGLVRLNLPDQASTLAAQMMSDGVPVRCKTLEAIFCCIRNNSDHDLNGTCIPTQLLESSDVLSLRPSMLRHKGTKFAVDLLMVARRSRQRRSHNMFKFLMALCIVNGEIIVASLLFGILLRDWQARDLTGNLIPETGPAKHHPKTPFPTFTSLSDICKSVKCNLASDKSDVDSLFAFKASLQALANLATMLDHQAIAYYNISPLLTALYKCPQVPDMVWIHDHSGNLRQVVAYKYFHMVLHRFILSLPTHPPAQDERKKILPPLDIYSYNCLLYYALRHRHSTALAETILHHMIHERHQPLPPDTTTLNIITRSGTLLRDSEIVNLALSKLKESRNPFVLAPSASESSLTPSPLRSVLSIEEQSDDKYTLSARIAQLMATGKFHAVVALLPVFIPTLLNDSKDKLDDFAKRHHEQDLHRSMLLGPFVFTSFLDALQRSGRTGLAERVWQRARMVEKMSWTVEVRGRLRPWCLSVVAYTIMIKLYAEEAKKAHFDGK
jgi:hypothetical protein